MGNNAAMTDQDDAGEDGGTAGQQAGHNINDIHGNAHGAERRPRGCRQRVSLMINNQK